MTRELVFTKASNSFTLTNVSVKHGNRGNGIEYLSINDLIDDYCDRLQASIFQLLGDTVFHPYQVIEFFQHI